MTQPTHLTTQSTAFPIKHWDTYQNGQACTHVMKMDDQRGSHGQVYLDIEPIHVQPDDATAMGLVAEINAYSEDKDGVPCLHISMDGNVVFSLFRDGDTLLIRPETDITLRQETREIVLGGQHRQQPFFVISD